MKKYIILSYIAILAGLCSCNDLLDLQNDGRTTMDEIFTTRNGVRGYLNLCYGSLPGTTYNYAAFCDDSQHTGATFSGTSYNYWYGNAFSANNFNSPDGRPWTHYFQAIRRCNVFLENMKNIDTSVIVASEGEITGWVAQAQTLRALYYLQLIKRFGSVPLILEPYSTGHDYSTDKKSSFSEIVTQILADCDAALAAPNIEQGFTWKRSNGQNNMMTRAVAYMIKSEAVTFAASPLFTDGTYTWEDATRINKEALYECTRNGYELFTDKPAADIAQNAYALYFLTQPDELGAYDKETIYGANGTQIWKNDGMPSTAGQTNAGACPTQELVDCYEMQETGMIPISGYRDDKHLEPIINTASGYDPENPYEGRDPRFYASVYYHGAPRTLGDSETPTRDEHIKLGFNLGSANQATAEEVETGVYRFVSTGGDPFVSTTTLAADLESPPSIIIRFKYKSDKRIESAEFFFAAPGPAGGEETGQRLLLEQTSEWKDFELDLAEWTSASWWKWGKKGHSLRFDFATAAGHEVYIKDFEINIYAAPIPPTLVDISVGSTDGISITDQRTTHTGYYLRKYNRWNSNRNNNADGYVRFYRLAELYMNFAESAYQSNGPDAKIELGAGVSMSARDAINVVRARAEMPPLPAGLSKEEFEKRYRNERRVEFAYESQRFFDVRRWKILEETERYVTGMRITADGEFNRISFERGSYISKYYLYPLEPSEVNKMQDYTGVNWQNPGWN